MCRWSRNRYLPGNFIHFSEFWSILWDLVHFSGFRSTFHVLVQFSGLGPIFWFYSFFGLCPTFPGFNPFILRVILVVPFNAVSQLVTSLIENVTVGSFVALRPLVRDVISTDSPAFTWTFLTKVFSIGFMIGSK